MAILSQCVAILYKGYCPYKGKMLVPSGQLRMFPGDTQTSSLRTFALRPI